MTTSFRTPLGQNLRRAVIMAAVVGTTLLLINHGDHIEEEPVCSYFAAKAGLCYLVPFLVSIVSAILADRARAHLRDRER